LRSGKEVQADFLVIADGIKVSSSPVVRVSAKQLLIGDNQQSDLRKYILGRTVEPKASGLFCYRFVIPIDLLLKDPECNWLTEDLNAVQIPTDKKHRRIVFYPCRSSTLMNVAAIFEDRKNKKTRIGE
jgi:hypothetical protein